jgi:hypothetical protein
VLALLVKVIVAEVFPPDCTTAFVPLGTPLTVTETGPEFPEAVAVICAGVPSWGASAIDEESDKLSVPGPPPELPVLLHAPANRQAHAQQASILMRLDQFPSIMCPP